MAAPAAAVSAGAGAAAGKERDGLGLGSGGERALQAGKRFRTAPGDIVLKIGSEKDRLRIFNDMTNDVHIGSWLDTSSAAKAAFVETERCKCKICKTTKQYVKMSDMRAHADGPMHKKKAGEMVVALRLKAKRMAALGVEVVKDTKLVPHEVAARARGAAHGMLIALGCNPTLIGRIFASGVVDVLAFAQKYSLGAGKSPAARSDLQLCADMVKLRIKGMLKGRTDLFYALVIDGAGSKVMGGHHINAILIWSSEFPKPILLKLDISPNGSGKAEVIAAAIVKVAKEYELDLAALCVGIMADNAAVNNKVAKVLGFKRQLRCLAHTVALLILAAIEAVPGVKTFLLALHAIFTAGGNTSRRIEASESVYADAGLNVRAICLLYLNRWGTASELLEALTIRGGRMLGALRDFFNKAKSIAAFKEAIDKVKAAGAGSAAAAAKEVEEEEEEEEEDDDDDDDDEKKEKEEEDAVMYIEDIDADDATAYIAATSVGGAGDGEGAEGFDCAYGEAEDSSASGLQAAASSASSAAAASLGMAKVTTAAVQRRKADVGSAALRFVGEALDDEDMYPKLLLVASLIDQMDFLIVMSSRDDSTFSNSLIKDILSVGEGLRSAAADPESSYFLAPVLEKLGADYPAEKKAMLFGYANVAVQNMTAKYRHVEEWSDTLRKKVMWDHRVPDYNDTLVLGKKVKAADGSSVDDKRLTAGWFGMTKQPTMAFIGQWNLWVGEARTKEELALEPGEYWRSKDKSYPLLYKLGLWYAAIPLSAVSAERAIGLMREVETPKRNSMKKASWHAECFLRYNKWLTEGIFDDVSGDVATLHKCIKSPQAASAAAAVEAAAAAADAPF